MTDTYSDLVNSKVGKQVASRLGLPRPVRLRRYAPGQPLVPGPVLVAGVGDGPLAARAADLLRGDAIDIIPVVADGQRVGAVARSEKPRPERPRGVCSPRPGAGASR